MTRNSDHDSQKKKQEKATLGGETVEPRILLSASWLVDVLTTPPAESAIGDDKSGDDLIQGSDAGETLTGGAGNDVLRGEGGDDHLVGGPGNQDVADYSSAQSGVNIDLSTGTVSGGAGNDTLSGIEAAIGSSHADTFAFTNAQDGDVFTVLGNGGSDTMDLSDYSSSAVTFANGSLTIDLGGGDSFQIDYAEIDTIAFGDITATVLDADIDENDFSGSGIYIYDDAVFSVAMTGSGTVDWDYDESKREIEFKGWKNSDASTALHIDDLGDSITVKNIDVNGDVGTITSDANIAKINVHDNLLGSVSVHGGAGAIGTFEANNLDGATSIHATVGTLDIKHDVNASLHVAGSVGTFVAEDIHGDVQIDGKVTSFTAKDVTADIALLDDMDKATFDSFSVAGTLKVMQPSGTASLTVNSRTVDVDRAGEAFGFSGAEDSIVYLPKAEAGNPQTVAEGDVVTLDGSTSTDPQSIALTYTWTQVSGPAVTLSDPNAAQPTFTTPDAITTTKAVFELTVSNGLFTSTDTVELTIHADDDAPTADAGADQVVTVGDVVTLNAAASTDPEGQALTFTWTQVSGTAVTLSDANAEQPTFSAAAVTSPTTLTFEVTVSDGTNSTTDTVEVLVNPAHLVANWTFDGTGQAVADVTGHGNDGLLGTDRSTDNDPVRVTDPDHGDVMQFGDNQWISGIGQGPTGNFTVSSWLNHDGGGSGWQTVYSSGGAEVWVGIEQGTGTIRMHVGGTSHCYDTAAGAITEDTWHHVTATWDGANGTIYVDGVAQALTQMGTPHDPRAANAVIGGNSIVPLTFNYHGMLDDVRLYDAALSQSEVTAIATPPAPAPVMAARDAPAMAPAVADTAPIADAGTDQTANEGDLVTLNALNSSDAEDQALTFTWTQLSGPSVTLSDTTAGQPTFTAPEGLTNTVVSFQVAVFDGTNTSLDTVAITINANNDAPTANAGADAVSHTGDLVTLDASGSTDPEGQPLTYTWTQTSGPAVTLSDANAAQPTFSAGPVTSPTTLTFEVAASDGTNTSVDTVQVIVNPGGLIGNWTFEGTGQTVTDVSGQGNDGVLGMTTTAGANDPVRVNDPIRGDVIQNADNQFITGIGNGPAGDFTISSWIQYDGNGVGWDAVYSSGAGETWLGINSDDGRIALGVGGTGNYVETAPGVVTAGAWQHIAGTWDGATATIYVDGVAMSVTQFGTLQDPVAAAAAIGGLASDPFEQNFHGLIDDVRAYNGVLAANEIGDAAANLAPTANAGVDQTVDENDLVTLTAAASADAEAGTIAYSWTQTSGPSVILSDANAMQPTFSAPEGLTNTTLTFEVTATDSFGASTTDTVTISVNADNDAPAANAGANQTVDEGDVVSLTATASSDPEGQALSYTWTQVSGPAVTLSDAASATPTFTAPEGLTNSTVRFQLTASDGTTASVDTVDITIHADDDAPTADAGWDQTVHEGDLITLDGANSSDPEGQALTYTWTQVSGPAVVLSDPHAAQPSFTAPEGVTNSTIQFQLAVSDGTNVSLDTVDITVNADNDAPTADAGANFIQVEGRIAVLDGSGSTDPEAQGLTYSWRQISGTPVAIENPNSAIASFTVPEGLSNSTARFELTVSDGTTSSVDVVRVAMHADDDAPTADAGLDQVVDEGDVVLLDGANSIDPEGQNLTYTWEQVSGPPVVLVTDTSSLSQIAQSPVGVQSFSTATLSVNGQIGFLAPEGLTNATAVFQLTVHDGTSTSVDTVSVTINANNDAPTVDAGANRQVTSQEVVQLNAQASDPENQPLSYEWRQISGPTVQLTGGDTATPSFTVPPGHIGENIVFGVQVSDGTSTTFDTVGFHIENTPPTVVASSSGTATTGDTVNLSALAQDRDGDELTYKWKQLGGPTVTLGTQDQPNAMFQAPDVNSTTTLTFAVEVDDGEATAVRIVTVTIEPDIEPEREVDPPTGSGNEGGTTIGGSVTPTEPTNSSSSTGSGNGSGSGSGSGSNETGTNEGDTGTSAEGDLAGYVPDGDDERSDGDSDFRSSVAARDTSQLDDTEDDDKRRSDSGDGDDDQSDDARAQDNVPNVSEHPPVLALAGSEVRVEAPLALPDSADEVQFQWTQLSGTAVSITSGNTSALRIELPETFSEEELVFEVEMLVNGEIHVQEITVRVQPVDAETRETQAQRPEFKRLTERHDDTFEEQRGVGKLWASLVAFTSMGPIRARS